MLEIQWKNTQAQVNLCIGKGVAVRTHSSQSSLRFIIILIPKNAGQTANKCLFTLRSLRKESYSQAELDYLSQSLVIPNLTYGLSVYGRAFDCTVFPGLISQAEIHI